MTVQNSSEAGLEVLRCGSRSGSFLFELVSSLTVSEQGGEAVWGNGTHAPDDPDDADHSHGHFVAFRDPGASTKELHERTDPGIANLTAGDVTNWILESTPVSYQKMVASNYSFGLERDEKQLQANNYDFRKWTNPLEIQWAI
jgi:phospholipid:diacylglycerol acyltransferase